MFFVILVIDAVHLGCNSQRYPNPPRDFDGAVGTFLRTDTSEECEILASGAHRKQIFGQTVIDRSLPVRRHQRTSLRMRNGNDWNVAELAIQRLKLRHIQPSV